MRKDLCRAKSHGKHLMKQRSMKISLNTYFSLGCQFCACATELCRCFAFSKRFAALFWKCSLCFISRAVHVCTFQKLCHSLHCSADFNLVSHSQGMAFGQGTFRSIHLMMFQIAMAIFPLQFLLVSTCS